jgi:hypothetical protein
MNLPNAIERLRDVLRLQHKALSTESSHECAESVGIAPGWKEPPFQMPLNDTSAALARFG